jgi:hypothetical protein
MGSDLELSLGIGKENVTTSLYGIADTPGLLVEPIFELTMPPDSLSQALVG